jgi:spermidine synthase
MSAATSPANASITSSHRFLPLLVALFVGSGCAALIYEIVWLQMLQLVIGATAVSLGVLLGTFMGGMCLGSLLLPRLISEKAHPLRVYAYLELGIAVCGLFILFGVPMFEGIYAGLGLPHGAVGIFWRAVVAVIFLLPPTVLMGATLPAVARWVETTPRGVAWLGFFYGGNIVGAVVGCLLAGFFLLRVYDMQVATYCAMALNFAVAGLAILFASAAPYEPQRVSVGNRDRSLIDTTAPGAWVVYLTIGLSGLTALGAEVVWTRVLSLTFGGTVYSFSIILGVFLMGLGIGSSVGALVSRTVQSPRLALGICQLCAAGGIAWAGYVTSLWMPFWPTDPSAARSQWFVIQLDMARAIFAVLPGACFWGASFPLALAAAAGPGKEPGRLVGGLYAINTIGAILGALAFSMWVIPALATPEPAQLWAQSELTLGTQRAQQILIAVAFISGMIALLPVGRTAAATARPSTEPDLSALFWWLGGGVVAGAAALVAIAYLPAIPWGLAAHGRFMASRMHPDSNELALDAGIVREEEIPAWVDAPYDPNPDTYCLYMGEGMNVTVAVTQSNRYGTRSFHGSGKVQASSEPTDMRLQRMLGHIPALVHKNPKSVLVVACGAGVTAGSFIPHPEVDEIVICDIEPLVPTYVTPFFSKENFNIVGRYVNGRVTDRHFIENGRVKLVYDDGRHYINTLKDKKFDVITSDPIDPWAKGTAALNSREYYQKCKDHLNPGGVMALWMPIYESNEETLKSVIATFYEVFPKGILWTNDSGSAGYDAVLFGQPEGTVVDFQELQARLARDDHEPVRESMREVGFNSIFELLGTYGGDGQRMQKWCEGAQINTDRNMRLQYLAGMALNTYEEKKLLDGILKYYEFPDDIFKGSESDIERIKQELANNGRQ